MAKPLEMKYAFYTWNDHVAQHRASGHVEGEVNPGWGISERRPGFFAAYGLQTEAVSYANFLIEIMNDQGLTGKSPGEMLKVHINTPSSKDSPSWGLGIAIKSTPYGTQYKHGGDNLSFTSNFLFNKEQKSGYVFSQIAIKQMI